MRDRYRIVLSFGYVAQLVDYADTIEEACRLADGMEARFPDFFAEIEDREGELATLRPGKPR